MNGTAGEKAVTLADAIRIALAGAKRSPDGVAPPVAILWTDADGQWLPLVPALKSTLPELYSLGTYEPKSRTGPVIWLKCVVDRTISDVSPPQDSIPVLYLPRVSRQDLRAGGDCPRELQPLVELQYRGAVWHQRNGRDWTVDAFFGSEQGLGLDIAQDARTREALLRALPLLANEPIDTLRTKRLEAEDFDRIAIGDPVRDLLAWVSDPQGFEARCEGARWATFRDVCRREFNLDVDKGGPSVAGDALLNGGGRWDEAWRRFEEAPTVYPGVADRLRAARPRDMFVDRARQPALNDAEERVLREGLEAVAGLAHGEACERVLELEKAHGERRAWVWARIGGSPLAMTLSPLAQLAAHARNPVGGATLDAVASDYASRGWRADHAVIEALGTTRSAADAALMGQVARTLYETWLDRSTRRFQELVTAEGADIARRAAGVRAEKDTCVLFADGLRFDVAAMLCEQLEARDFRVRLTHRMAPLPTVTATAKPLASPAHESCAANPDASEFVPLLKDTGQPVTAQRLRQEMVRTGVEVIDANEIRFAGGSEAGGWSEIGRLDEFGHSLGLRLIQQIGAEVEAIAERIAALLGSGWLRVRVVTDHGWLLLPGGLPRIDLPPHLVATKWARCAAVKGESSPAVPTYAWYWAPQARIASPPGIGSFFAGQEYAHGGVSPQECVVPELVVERGVERVRARLRDPVWRGMRCRVALDAKAGGLRADLRLNWKHAASSIAASVKEFDANGEASLAVADDRHEGAAAAVVLLDASDNVLDYKPTTVGEHG